jgi:hypothetical protein
MLLISCAGLRSAEVAWETTLYAMMGLLYMQGLYNFIPSCAGADWPVVVEKIVREKIWGIIVEINCLFF